MWTQSIKDNDQPYSIYPHFLVVSIFLLLIFKFSGIECLVRLTCKVIGSLIFELIKPLS